MLAMELATDYCIRCKIIYYPIVNLNIKIEHSYC